MKNKDVLLSKCFQGGVDELVFWSFRYFVGRMTIHSCCFADDLVKAWPLLTPHTQKQIQTELDELFIKDNTARADKNMSKSYYPLGIDSNREHWERVRLAYTTYER